MVESEGHVESEGEPRLPQGLSDDLARLYGVDVEVPPEVDQAVLAQAQEQLARRPLRGIATGAGAGAAGQTGRGTRTPGRRTRGSTRTGRPMTRTRSIWGGPRTS